MKKIDDHKLYMYFAIATLAIAVIIGAISLYSKLVVEPKVDTLLSSTEDINQNYREAYRMLRDAQVFARYQNFDSEATSLITYIRDFDRKVYTGDEFLDTDIRAMEDLLRRRAKGSSLGIYTTFFFLLLSALGGGAFLYEKRQLAKTQ
ncbi:MAG: hypothetical protein JXA20_03450 [Spirochaetes bacterium]|nr:hypothetical protein [Spirochaetota bacterium]